MVLNLALAVAHKLRLAQLTGPAAGWQACRHFSHHVRQQGNRVMAGDQGDVSAGIVARW
jgi:hypothetical protein